jgi:hypothetical protein
MLNLETTLELVKQKFDHSRRQELKDQFGQLRPKQLIKYIQEHPEDIEAGYFLLFSSDSYQEEVVKLLD